MIDHPERIGTHAARADWVVHGLCLLSAIGDQILVGVTVWSWKGLACADLAERRLGKDSPYQP